MKLLIRSLLPYSGAQKVTSPSLFSKRTATRSLAILLVFTFAYIIVLTAFALIWAKYPQFLYMYRDGEYNLWISLKYAEWSRPYDITSINPLQGMTSMLVAINPYFDPGQWVFFSELPQDIKILTSYAIYALEVIVSTLALGITLGFSRLHSFVASIWTALLLFPPFNFFFGLGGWLCVAPMYAHMLALSNLCLIACLNLGVCSTACQTKFHIFRRNSLFVGILVLLIIVILIAAPFYNAGMLLGTIISLGCITLCSHTREQFYWRVFAGFTVIITFYILGLPEFYASAKAYTARYFEDSPFIAINWPNDIGWLSQESIAKAWKLLCAYGVHCGNLPGWPISVNTAWVNGAIILGGIIAWLTMKRTPARIGIFLAVVWITILLASTLFALGFLSSLFAPCYFYLMLYSLLALYSLHILALPIKMIADRTKHALNSIQVSMVALIIALSVSGWLIYSFSTTPVQMTKLGPETTNSQTAVILENRHQATPLIQLLKQEIALYPGTNFRGLVATVYGTAEGSLRNVPSVSHTATVSAWQFEEFLAAAAAQTGSSHDLLDLWTWNIPTLSEYGQGLSRPLMFYILKFLTSPGDMIESHFAFPHRPNIDILQALGVRFVIIDTPLSSEGVTLRREMQSGKNATLFLYELSTPNLGNYSPTHLLILNDVDEFYRKIRANPKRLKTDAFVEAPFQTNLTPAYDAKMVYQKNGVHITAKSNGTSALLLPLQFSHCYRLNESSISNVKIMRANLIHTLIIFKKNLNTDLIWEFRWGKSKCRQQDIIDMKKISLPKIKRDSSWVFFVSD